MGDALGISGAAKDAVDTRRRDRREEIFQVEADHDLLSGVPAGVRERRVPAAESVSVGMRRDRVENPAQHLPLHLLEQRLRALEQARRTALAGTQR